MLERLYQKCCYYDLPLWFVVFTLFPMQLFFFFLVEKVYFGVHYQGQTGNNDSLCALLGGSLFILLINVYHFV
jgi:hypothetical protein